MLWRYNDGGRALAGFKASKGVGDCATRSIAIVTGKSYREVYDAINQLAKFERRGKHKKGISSAREGVYRTTVDRYMRSLNWKWTPTMFIGSGCTVHLRDGELPARGRLLVGVSLHYTAVKDGVIHDTDDPSRDGTRCVYGYWSEPEEETTNA